MTTRKGRQYLNTVSLDFS